MTESIAAKQAAVVDEFQFLPDWQERYRRIIEIARELPPYPEAVRDEAHKVKGCQSQVWLNARFNDGRVCYDADSDALITRGLVALLVKVFSDHSPEEILAAKTDFVDALGLTENLTLQRRNGLHAMIKQLKYYALAFRVLRDQGQAGGAAQAHSGGTP